MSAGTHTEGGVLMRRQLSVTLPSSRSVLAALALAVLVGGLSLRPASATVGSGSRTTYVGITPCRLVDTRQAPATVGPRSSPLGTDDTYVVDALPPSGGCPVPATATALQLNVTATDASAATFLTIWPSDAVRPNASSLNPAGGQGAVPNAVTTVLSADGRFSIFNAFGSVNVIVDVVGYFDDVDFDDRYYPRAEADAATAAAIASAAETPMVYNQGTAMDIAPFQCIDVLATGGALPSAEAGKLVTGYITDAGGVNPPPSINNATVFRPGVVFKTSQSGAVGYVEVCNPTSQPKALPQGWKLIASVKP